MKRIVVFLLLILAASPAFSLTDKEREKQAQIWNEMVKGWTDAKNEWEKNLSKHEKEIKDLKDKTDISAREEKIKEKAQDILKKAPKGIAESLTGKTKKAALTAIRAAKDHADQRKANGEIEDIIYNDSENSKKLSALEKNSQDLEKNIQVANSIIELATQNIAKLNAVSSELKLPQWIHDALVKAMQAEQRVNARREADRKKAEVPKEGKEPKPRPEQKPGKPEQKPGKPEKPEPKPRPIDPPVLP